MSKVFTSAYSLNREMAISPENKAVLIKIIDRGDYHGSIAIDPSHAPALALAILEVAHGSDQPAPGKIGEAWSALYVHIAEQERATAEAEAQAKLEAEALELCNAWREANGYDALSSFSDGAPIGAMAEWLAVARRAREMRAEK